jgi:hypothetical protein
MFISMTPTTKIRPTVQSYLLKLGRHEHYHAHRAVTNTIHMAEHRDGGYVRSSRVNDDGGERRLARSSRLERRDDGGEGDSKAEVESLAEVVPLGYHGYPAELWTNLRAFSVNGGKRPSLRTRP